MKQKIFHFSNILARKALRINTIWASKYWHDQPFSKHAQASHDEYMQLWQAEKQRTYTEIDALESKESYAVPKDWLDELALHTQIVIKNSPLCYQHGRVLYTVLSTYINSRTNPSENLTIFETGTARGFSSTIMAKALSDNKASGKIITFDVLPHNTPMYWNCIDDHTKQKTRAELLSPWQELTQKYIVFVEGDSFINLQKIKPSRIHFAFLDGAHYHDDVAYEFKTIAMRQKKGDVIVFDDYNTEQFPGLVKAVDTGCLSFKYEKRVISIGSNRAYVIATKRAD